MELESPTNLDWDNIWLIRVSAAVVTQMHHFKYPLQIPHKSLPTTVVKDHRFHDSQSIILPKTTETVHFHHIKSTSNSSSSILEEFVV